MTLMFVTVVLLILAVAFGGMRLMQHTTGCTLDMPPERTAGDDARSEIMESRSPQLPPSHADRPSWWPVADVGAAASATHLTTARDASP